VTALDCAREPEVVQAVMAGRLAACQDLGQHVESCDVCREVVAITRLFREDRDATLADVHLPAAGQVWWRAAVRARLDAAHAAARPLTWATGVAAACAAGLTVGVVGIAWPTIDRALTWFGDRAGSMPPPTLAVADLTATLMQRTLPFALAAAFVVLAPVALFLALSDGKR
jgi:hypothetical protein